MVLIPGHTFLFAFTLVNLCAGIYCMATGKEKPGVVLMIAYTFLANLLVASLDPFLNIWDERFHALVAKNLMEHPLMPTLYDNPVLDIAYDRWDRYHIWLHKQPLFLWQIALSFKLFGINELSLRIPNVVMGTVMTYAAYRTGKLVVNTRTGLLTGFFISTSYFILNLLSGRQAVDHCDFAFLVYVTLSIWALVEYKNSGKWYWVVLTGVFSGFAILCKWLVGLLVYFVWFVYDFQYSNIKKIISRELVVSLIITLLVALPWQLLILSWYPAEAALSYKYNTRHVFEALDGQGGDFLYHFRLMNELYGKWTLLLILPALILMIKNAANWKMAYALASMALLVYLFFSAVATKMPAFTIVAALPVFLALASMIDQAGSLVFRLKIPQLLKRLLFMVVVVLFIAFRFDVKSLKENHLNWDDPNSYSSMLYHNRMVFKSLDLPSNTVIFNVPGRRYIEAMFYTGLPAYNKMPVPDDYEILKAKNYKVALFKPMKEPLPAWILDHKDIIVIDKPLKGFFDQ